jgi:hypothetical protein
MYEIASSDVRSQVAMYEICTKSQVAMYEIASSDVRSQVAMYEIASSDVRSYILELWIQMPSCCCPSVTLSDDLVPL